MATLKELKEQISVKSRALYRIFEEAGPEIDMDKVWSLEGDSQAKVQKIQAMNKELETLHKELEPLMALENARERAQKTNSDFNKPGRSVPLPGADRAFQIEAKSLGQQIMEHKDDLMGRSTKSFVIPLELKTLFETTAGWATETTRIPRVELFPLRELVVVDFLPQFPTTQSAVVYMEETTATLSAAEKAEAVAYAESTFVLTERTETVRKITTSLPVTDEQLADVPAAEAYINSRLTYDIRRRLDLQVLEGNGVAPNLKGTLNVSGIQSQALGTDPVPDAIYKAFDLIRTDGFAEPSVLFINPTDWQPVRLLRTADGLYIFGSPLEKGATTIWGIPVVQTTAVSANTALCGAYDRYAALYVRNDLEISTGFVGSDFTLGRKTIRADIRVAVVHFRPKAFGKITGI